jgi:hypothetical protein
MHSIFLNYSRTLLLFVQLHAPPHHLTQSQDENEPASSLQNNICQSDFAFVSNIFIFRTCRNSETLFFLNLRILVSIAPGSAGLLPAKTPPFFGSIPATTSQYWFRDAACPIFLWRRSFFKSIHPRSRLSRSRCLLVDAASRRSLLSILSSLAVALSCSILSHENALDHTDGLLSPSSSISTCHGLLYHIIGRLPTTRSLRGDSRNFSNLQTVNVTTNRMLQQCRLSRF